MWEGDELDEGYEEKADNKMDVSVSGRYESGD